MNQIVIFRHVAHEGPGYVAEYLDRLRISHRLVRIDQNDAVPSSLDGISGLVFMGGPMSVKDDLPWIAKVTALIRQAVAADTPVLGHCLGGQLIAKALGARITRNPVKEIGWLPVHVVEGGAARDWLDGLASPFEAFHWHSETFAIPDGASRILASRDCPNQGFVYGRTLALQCHVEMTPAMVGEWARINAGELREPTRTVQSAAQMSVDLDARIERMQRIADRLYERWLRGIRVT